MVSHCICRGRAVVLFAEVGVGDGLRGQPRDSFFLTTMTSPCIHTASAPHRNITDPVKCKAQTRADVMQDLANLQLEHVDLLLLHGPAQAYGTIGACQPDICDITRAQWAAYIELQREGKARAIGKSGRAGGPLLLHAHSIISSDLAWPDLS